ETGTGKGLVAQVIHDSGPRKNGPFVSVNCASLDKGLFASELFGVRGGAATGVTEGEGRFRAANHGTLFLDEITEIPMEQQGALRAALVDDVINPVGVVEPVPVDVRIIAATNRDVTKLVEEGKFRPDLLYRLDVIRVDLPPLRERKGDIPELARHFAAQFAARDRRPAPELAGDFLADLMQRDWPGNIRELLN